MTCHAKPRQTSCHIFSEVAPDASFVRGAAQLSAKPVSRETAQHVYVKLRMRKHRIQNMLYKEDVLERSSSKHSERIDRPVVSRETAENVNVRLRIRKQRTLNTLRSQNVLNHSSSKHAEEAHQFAVSRETSSILCDEL